MSSAPDFRLKNLAAAMNQLNALRVSALAQVQVGKRHWMMTTETVDSYE